MYTIRLLATWAIVFIGWGVMSPHSPGTFSKLEASWPLSKSIKFLWCQFHVDLHKLVLDNESLVNCIDQSQPRLWTLKRKWKWVIFEFKVIHFQSILVRLLLFFNNVFRDFESCLIGIIGILQGEEGLFVVGLTESEAHSFDVFVVITGSKLSVVHT